MKTFLLYWNCMTCVLCVVAIVIICVMRYGMKKEKNQYNPVALGWTGLVFAVICFTVSAWTIYILMQGNK